MTRRKPYRQHLRSSSDLVTTYEAIRAGFIALALEKSRRTTPIVEQARALKTAALTARTPSGLLKIKGIQAALLTAAGVSDKATKYLEGRDRQEAIEGLIANFLEPAGSNFVEELVFRFLIIRGDTLGGSMRNIGGAMAQKKLSRSLISALALNRTPYRWLHGKTKPWVPAKPDDPDVEYLLRGLSWTIGPKQRTAIFNLTVPFLRNNVDVCLFDCAPEDFRKSCKSPTPYLAVGELKGGIDPAGADEHWKTAGRALDRIRKGFAKKPVSPQVFFIGAAIQKKMAKEIWEELADGRLQNAANLTDDDQIASLAQWLCSL